MPCEHSDKPLQRRGGRELHVLDAVKELQQAMGNAEGQAMERAGSLLFLC